MEDNGMTLGMRSLWEQGQFLNFNIQVEACNFKVHKVVMMANSDYFKNMFTGTAVKRPKDGVKIEAVSTVAMENLINYMYTSEMNLTKDNAAEVLAGAMFLQIPRAVKCCTQFIIGVLEIDTCRDALALFRSYDLMEAAEKVVLFMKKNVWKMIKTVDLSKLSWNELHFYVENWQSTEWDLFLFIMDWVKVDAKRDEHLGGLLTCVRYCLMPTGDLDIIKHMQCYHRSPNIWSHLVDEAIDYHNLPTNLKVLHGSEQAKVRSAPILVLFSGEQSEFGGYIYDSQKRCLIENKALRTPEGYFECEGEVDINNYLVICTGTRSCGKESWYIYDPRTGIWFKMADLPRQMESENPGLTGSNPSVLTNDNKHLYAVRESIERYDFKTDSWSDFSRMPLEVQFFGAGVCKNGLYVCGGRKPYNPVPVPQTAIKNESQDDEESFKDNDYSSEESDSSSQEKDDDSVEETRYPGPEYSKRMDRLDLSTLKWESRAPMLAYHRDHSLYTMKLFGEEVLCIFNNVTDMEYYNPSLDQWSTCSFTLNVPIPIQPERDHWVHNGPKRWCKGRMHFLADINLAKKFGREKNACVTVTYPEEGTEAVIDFLCEYEGQFQQLSQTRSLKGEIDADSYLIYDWGGGCEKQNCHPTVACFPPCTK